MYLQVVFGAAGAYAIDTVRLTGRLDAFGAFLCGGFLIARQRPLGELVAGAGRYGVELGGSSSVSWAQAPPLGWTAVRARAPADDECGSAGDLARAADPKYALLERVSLSASAMVGF